MAITNATRVADFGSGIGTEGAVLQVDNTNNRIGIGTTNPNQMLQVGTGVSVYGNSGIVSATSFFGDGANLTNVGMDTGTLVSDQVFVLGVTTSASAIVGSAVTINSTGIDAVSGVITATTFVGGLTGNSTTATKATSIQVDDSGGDTNCFPVLTASGATGQKAPKTSTNLSFNSSTGKLTATSLVGSGVTINSTGIEVTSGIITAGTCFKAGGGSFGPGIGATILGSGNAVFAGIVTATTLKYGTTSVETAIDAKASTGKAIAMAMVFGF